MVRRGHTFIRFLASARKGWEPRYVRSSSPRAAPFAYVLASFNIKVNYRPELGEVNKTRIANMRLGCELINGRVIPPGGILSLERFWGDASAALGFGEGPTIIDGVTSVSSGGGLCLVSSLVFNVALLADLAILEKHNHSVDLWGSDRFVPLGMDAAYAYGFKDVKVANRGPHPVHFAAWFEETGPRFCAAVTAQAPLPAGPEISQEVLEKILPPGHTDDTCLAGWVVRVKRTSHVSADAAPVVTYDSTERYALRI